MSKEGKDITKLDYNSLVRQSNEIVEANYKLTLAEQKIMLCLIANIDTSKDNFEVARINAKSLSDACGFNPKSGYHQLETAIKNLMKRIIVLKHRDGSGWYASHWVQTCDYIQGSDDTLSYVQYELDPRLCPHFLQLRERFLKLHLNSLVSFSHVYSTRFYMIFKNHMKIGHVKCTFAEIIKLFELPKSYETSINNLKSKVIRRAIDEINEKSDMIVEYSYYKGDGRKHIGVNFSFHQKPGSNEPPVSTQPLKKSPFAGLDEEQENVLKQLVGSKWEVTEDVALKMIKKYPLDEIKANIKYANKYLEGKRNPAGWLIKCIEQDFAKKTQKADATTQASSDSKEYEQTDLLNALLEEDARQNDSDSTTLGTLSINHIKSELKEKGALSKVMEAKLKSVGMTIDEFVKLYM